MYKRTLLPLHPWSHDTDICRLMIVMRDDPSRLNVPHFWGNSRIMRRWSRKSDSNRWPDDYKSTALPTELFRHGSHSYLVDATWCFCSGRCYPTVLASEWAYTFSWLVFWPEDGLFWASIFLSRIFFIGFGGQFLIKTFSFFLRQCVALRSAGDQSAIGTTTGAWTRMPGLKGRSPNLLEDGSTV